LQPITRIDTTQYIRDYSKLSDEMLDLELRTKSTLIEKLTGNRATTTYIARQIRAIEQEWDHRIEALIAEVEAEANGHS
jgi:hypothetical protein